MLQFSPHTRTKAAPALYIHPEATQRWGFSFYRAGSPQCCNDTGCICEEAVSLRDAQTCPLDLYLGIPKALLPERLSNQLLVSDTHS